MRSRHSAPIFVADGKHPIALRRVELGDRNEATRQRELFVQNLVFDNPEVIPMVDIEPAMSPLISVCRELPVGDYSADNLWITPWGGLVVGECKLVRNPQARREVVAQALDYARIIAGWTYEDLEKAIARSRKEPSIRLWNLVESQTDLDEAQFVDAVERRLRAGRMLLLIIGDGIQEGVEALTSHLQLHAGIHAGMALVELSIWSGMDGGLLVVPRIPMKTVLIERGVVTLDQSGVVRIAPSVPGIASGSTGATSRTSTQSEAEFFDHLSTRRLDWVEPLKTFLASLRDTGITPEYRKSVVFRFSASADLPNASAGFVQSNGQVWVSDGLSISTRVGNPDIGLRYMEAIAKIASGRVTTYPSGSKAVVAMSGASIYIEPFLRATAEWKRVIMTFVDEIRATASS